MKLHIYHCTRVVISNDGNIQCDELVARVSRAVSIFSTIRVDFVLFSFSKDDVVREVE